MSRACAICSKIAVRANNVSHSNIKTNRLQKPNLQLMKIGALSQRVCSSCRRTINKKAVA